LSLASSLPAGSIAVFNLANNIQTLPLGLFGISFAIAAFPKLSQAMAKQDEQTFREAFISAARQILFYVIPITGLFLMLRAQVVRIILGQGAFSWDDTIRTADTLAVLAVSLPFQTLIPLLARGFYAKQDTWKPVIVGIGAELINITLALLLRPHFGIVGLAAAFSISCTLQCLWLWFSLRKTCHDLDEVSLWRACWKLILATVVMGVIVYPIRQLVGTLYPLRTFWQVFAQGSISALVGLVGFFLVAHLTHLEEYVQLRRTVMQRLWRKSEVKEGVEQAL
jgi:putative peptidoglycan lipid II flippase